MPIEYTVVEGDCISSIGFRFGFFPDTLWKHAENANLRQLRANPHSLLPGDVVFVPDLRIREEACAAEQKHRFRRKGVPAKLKLRLMLDDQPRQNVKYDFECGSIRKQGNADGDGWIEVDIPPHEPVAKLRVGEGDTAETYELALGNVPPIDTDGGVEARLRNLGYGLDEGLAAAVSAFQTKNGLSATGAVDAATRDKLKTAFGH